MEYLKNFLLYWKRLAIVCLPLFALYYWFGSLELEPATEDHQTVSEEEVRMIIDSVFHAVSKGELEKALTFADQWVTTNPSSTYANANRAGFKNDLGDFKGAYVDADKAVQLDSMFFLGYINRGAASENLGNLEQAVIDYTTYIKLVPDTVDGYMRRGKAYKKLKRHADAIQDYTMAIAIDSNYVEAYFQRGVNKNSLGEYFDALQDFNTVTNIGWMEGSGELTVTRDMPVHANRAFSKANLGWYGAALADMEIALFVDTANPVLYDIRGDINHAAGDKYGACQDWLKALNLSGDDEYKQKLEENCGKVTETRIPVES